MNQTQFKPQSSVPQKVAEHKNPDCKRKTTARMAGGVIEEWYRHGVISGVDLNSDDALRQGFENRNQQLIASFNE